VSAPICSGLVLNTCIVDENVDRAEFAPRGFDHFHDGGGLCEVGWIKNSLDSELLFYSRAFAFNRLGFAKAIQHDIAASFGKRARNAEAEAACRPCYDCSFSVQHFANDSIGTLALPGL
jgi:hypothetical protein